MSAEPLDPNTLAKLFNELERARGGVAHSRPKHEQQAQELYYQAMETKDPLASMELIDQALEIDPQNPDALLQTVDFLETAQERIEALKGIVKTAAERLGQEAFKKLAPHFWGHVETRPYMRARERLAFELEGAGFEQEATREFEEMLALNEGDNQGIRYHLLPSFLAKGELEKAQKLMEKYPDDCEWNPVFSWGRVLERLLCEDQEGAAEALKNAKKKNPFMAAYVKGHRTLPKHIPPTYALGSREEAQSFAREVIRAWAPYPEARKWLASA